MSTRWLSDRLSGVPGVEIDHGDPVLEVRFAGRVERVYCPRSDEYRVTADVVRKAKDLGATIISYPAQWCDATYEGKAYGKELGITVMQHSAFFGYLRSKGVALAE